MMSFHDGTVRSGRLVPLQGGHRTGHPCWPGSMADTTLTTAYDTDSTEVDNNLQWFPTQRPPAHAAMVMAATVPHTQHPNWIQVHAIVHKVLTL
jgi:hypothetical protein